MLLYIQKLFNSSKSELQVLFYFECQQPINYPALRDLPNKGKPTPKWKCLQMCKKIKISIAGVIFITKWLV